MVNNFYFLIPQMWSWLFLVAVIRVRQRSNYHVPSEITQPQITMQYWVYFIPLLRQWFSGKLKKSLHAKPVKGLVNLIHYMSSTIEGSLIARFMWPTWGPSGSWRPQMGPMLAPMNFAIWDVPHSNSSHFELTKDIPYLSLMDELFGIYCDYIAGNNPGMLSRHASPSTKQ